MNRLSPLWIAMQLLTRLPVPDPRATDATTLGRSLLYYPLVGLLIGTLLAASAWLLGAYFAPLPLGAFLLALWVALTGALHLDGLADSADGWLGGYGSPERTLEIMHDPRSGPAALVAVTLVLLLKFAALTVIAEKQMWAGLLCIPLLARTLVPLLFLTTPCARREGMAASLAARLPRRSAWLVVLLGFLAVALASTTGPWLLLGGLAAFMLMRRLMLARIGGLTGDTTGALVELSEAVALLALSAALP
jgi:adenosylcobinamide-GDP ribazoletransferase